MRLRRGRDAAPSADAPVATDGVVAVDLSELGAIDTERALRLVRIAAALIAMAAAVGTRDQAGNVSEWVQDELTIDGYDGLGDVDPVRNPDGGAFLVRGIRGGSWRDPPGFAMTGVRLPRNLGLSAQGAGFAMTGDDRFPQVGFRCAYAP